MKRTMVLANVGSADKPQYEQAQVTGVNEEGHTEVAFADGQVAVYRSQFHPAGILPVGVEAETASFRPLGFATRQVETAKKGGKKKGQSGGEVWKYPESSPGYAAHKAKHPERYEEEEEKPRSKRPAFLGPGPAKKGGKKKSSH